MAAALKKKEIEKLKAILLNEKKKILRHLEELSDSSEQGLDSTGSGDSVDIASAEINQASLQKIGKRESYLLKKIDIALEKIKNGVYGECEVCGEPIGIARLTARPVAQLCIDCKTDQENLEKRFSSREEMEEEEGIFAEEEEEQ